MRAPWRLFWVAFLVRVLYITVAHTYRFRPLVDHFQFGWEAGRIARSIVNGHGYGNPFAPEFFGLTGPTAWLPPLYPLLVAAVFKVFGVYSAASAWVLLAVNSALSGATAMLLWEFAARGFGRRVAVWSGWIWALYPAAMQYAVRWIWEMTLTTALLMLALVLTLRMRGTGEARESAGEPATTGRWLLFGLLWGLLALSTSTLVLVLPACAVWLLWGQWRRPHKLARAVLAGVVAVACVLPWMTRNWIVFHAFVPIRGNLGVESYLGNGPGATGLVMTYDHPNMSLPQLRLYQQMGEVRYAAYRGALTQAYVRTHRMHFAAISLKRVYFFWMSTPSDAAWPIETARVLNFGFVSLAGLMGVALALRRGVPGAALIAGAFLLLPVPYYLVMSLARFRHPLEPLLTVCGVYLFQSADRTRMWSWQRTRYGE